MAPLDNRKVGDLTIGELKEAMRSAIDEAFKDAGLPIETPADRKEAQANFLFMTKWRKAFDTTAEVVGKTVVASVVLAIMGVITWLITNHVINK